MQKLILLVVAIVMASLLVTGCGKDPCEPVFKDIHVFKIPPADKDAANAVLGKFLTEDCSGVHEQWIWFRPQADNLACRPYKGQKPVNRLIGRSVTDGMAKVIDETTGVDLDEGQDDYARMRVELLEECGVKRPATNFGHNPAVCERDGDRNDDFEPWWYVRRIYRLNWRNSWKMDGKDIAELTPHVETLQEMMPGLKIDAGPDAQAKGVLIIEWNDAWAAYRTEEVIEARCRYATFSKEDK